MLLEGLAPTEGREPTEGLTGLDKPFERFIFYM